VEFLLHLFDRQEGNAQKTTFGITLQGVSSDQNEMEAIKPDWNKFDLLMYYIRIGPCNLMHCRLYSQRYNTNPEWMR